MKYAFLVTIDEADSRADVIKTIRGANSILDLVEGRDPEPSDPSIFNRWVLKPSLLPAGTPEIPACGWVALNTNTPAVVRNEYSQNSTFWRTYTSTFDRGTMQARIRQFSMESGATDGWVIIPGDSLNVAAAGQAGDLLSKFRPII
jgi:hypothetical protein